MRVAVYQSPSQALEAALAWLLERLVHASSGALAGGRTPLPLYRALRGIRFRTTLVLSDERWLPPGDRGTNLAQVAEALGPQADHLLPFPLGLPPEEARARMEARLEGLLPLGFALLGVGEDGHTASLFPGHPALESPRLVEVVRDSPKPPPLRLTLTPKALATAEEVLFLALGEAKRKAVLRLIAGEDLPPRRIAAANALLITDQEV
ncbi:6-phosphogluconolactonase [Thermus islandicus]|uniref:6-phosphogluconolactonase n=1 Tax=Thermus islandicus TaxID=540988 RepID=UPI0003B35011|nr:6-phosphogluconolactonase [Thermus islandicus]